MKSFAVYKTKFGFFRIEYENNKISSILKMNAAPVDFGIKTALTEKVFSELTEYFNSKRKTFDIPLELHGTDFQKKVWAELCKIPYGETRSYKEIAQAIGNEKACRAVGMANNKNPVVIIVPCHRVIGSNGSLTGYACGLEMKALLLQLEKGNSSLV